MQFQANNFYHIYNRGNDKQKVFYSNRNYEYFLHKIKIEISSICDVLAYCLMPNHYHLLIYTPENALGLQSISNNKQQILTRKIGTVQSSYTQAINKQENKTGSIFQQKAKSKLVTLDPITTFHYIHQNPVRANLTKKMEDWEFSSFNEYYQEESSICNTDLAQKILDMPSERNLFYEQSYRVIQSEVAIDFLV
ncbi:MAG: transposase [Bacteroidetes bacterium]|nr:transposase [Bacteroidota bacterium]